MTYTPFLIANYATGLDKERQPWLLPNDAQEELYDGYVYRGVLSKRQGYTGLATGERGTSVYCESRMVNRITDEFARTNGGVLVQGNGTTGPYTFRIQNMAGDNRAIRRGTVSISAGAQTVLDNGEGVFQAPAAGSINCNTGDVSVTFQSNVGAGVQIKITYDYHPGEPVMGVMNFITQTNIKQLLVADTERVNLYDSNNNILGYVGKTLSISGISKAALGVVTTTGNHDLMTGDKIFIYGVQGMNEVNNREFTITKTGATTFTINQDTSGYTAYTSGGTIQLIYSGSNANFWSWVNYKDKDNNPRLIFCNNAGQVQYYAPHLAPGSQIGNYVNYPTNASTQFFMTADDGVTAISTFTASKVFEFKDRLIFIRTTENGFVKPQRIRISGTGAKSDDFRTTATGAGFIDIPDGTWINGAAYNRDDLIIFTSASTWVLKYTGNDITPFVLNKIDESRGCDAPFAAITYLNRTTAVSPRGMIITDGYRVERADENLPDYSYNEIDPEYFELCFAGTVDEDRDHYLIHPTERVTGKSSRILVSNYDEDNYSIYRLPLSCMGTYANAYDITWNDLLSYDNWAEFASAYGDWNSFAYSSGGPFSVGGGHHGEVWRLNLTEIEDNPQKIRNITIVDDSTIEVTTDWNNYSLNTQDPEMGADTIFLTGIQGMVEANDKQYPISEVIDNYTFRLKVPDTSLFSAYTSSGMAARVIPFTATFKKFNPFIEQDKKVRCGWIYFYVSSSGTSLSRNINITGITQSALCEITTDLSHNLKTGQQIFLFGIGGMTELNDQQYFITVTSNNTFTLDGVDSSAYTAYTNGGYVSVDEPAKLDIKIITNDTGEPTQVSGYQANTTNLIFEEGSKKWYKTYINQTGKFIQWKISNLQAGAKINIHATMPGFQPVGRMI